MRGWVFKKFGNIDFYTIMVLRVLDALVLTYINLIMLILTNAYIKKQVEEDGIFQYDSWY